MLLSIRYDTFMINFANSRLYSLLMLLVKKFRVLVLHLRLTSLHIKVVDAIFDFNFLEISPSALTIVLLLFLVLLFYSLDLFFLLSNYNY